LVELKHLTCAPPNKPNYLGFSGSLEIDFKSDVSMTHTTLKTQDFVRIFSDRREQKDFRLCEIL
jgi:hypothetical protein